MTDEELIEMYQTAYQYLKGKDIFELRQYGRTFGVAAPTSKHKQELILESIKLCTGIKERSKPSKRGARVRAKSLTDVEIEQFCNMLNVNPEPYKAKSCVKESIKTDEKEIVEEIEKLLGGYVKKGVYNFHGKLTMQEDNSFKLFLEGDLEQSNDK